MGLFDGYVDPQQFNGGGGLLGRLLAMSQGQFQPDASLDQNAPASARPPSMLLPLLSGYGQSQAYEQPAASMSNMPPISGFQNGTSATFNPVTTLAAQTQASLPDSAAVSDATSSSDPLSSAPNQNTMLAQYSPARPAGIFVPPNVFLPGTPENDAFSHWAIDRGRELGNAVGNILSNDSTENPVPGTTAEPETKGRSKIFQKPGGYDDAVKDFNGLNPANIRPIPNGGLVGTLPDGRTVNVRPGSSDGRPTIEVLDRKRSIKTRYGDKQ